MRDQKICPEESMRKKIVPTIVALVSMTQPLYAQTLAGTQSSVGSLRKVYFGDLHLHTIYSFDAYLGGAPTTPDQAYKFAQGHPISYEGSTVKRAWPLDFLAVTDHAEDIGVVNELNDPNSSLFKSEVGQKIRNKDWSGSTWLEKPTEDLRGFAAAWQKEMEAANSNYRPGAFTTFIGYEWTAEPNAQNLHRIVIFRGNTAPYPFTSYDSTRPEDLWTYLENSRKNGSDVLAMPHNANASSGLMYPWNDSDGKPIDRIYAQRRAFNEPLSEISQEKGQSETHPVLSSTDEFANFELMDFLASGAKGPREVHGSYVREAYGRGLVIASKVGVNPYKFGVEASSDIHTGLSESDEKTSGPSEGTKNLMEKYPEYKDSLYTVGSAGVTGVWAEQNTRESIFDALRRKETFGTSGTRLEFRFFGGWDYALDALSRKDWVKDAYAKGVPMGGDLPAMPRAAKRPRFLVSALKDPTSGNLDRVQIIKVWLKGNGYEESVFDVAWSGRRKPDPKTSKLPPVGNTVDVKTATYSNTIGATKLSTVWEDPNFDAKVPAVYYLRVLEIPTPRWSTIQAVKARLPLPVRVSATIQERGWSSPIWYSPVRN